MADHFDVVVVGAGPAGSACALLTARAGLRTLLLDKSHFPRERTCAHRLHPFATDLLRQMGLEASFLQLHPRPLHHLALHCENDPPVRLPLHPGTVAVPRPLLDSWLVDQARAAGATILTPVDLQAYTPHGILHTSLGDFQARLFVGADGAKSWMARATGLAGRNSRCPRVAWHAMIPADTPGDDLDVHVIPEGCLTRTPLPNGQTAITFVTDPRFSRAPSPQTVASRILGPLPPLPWLSMQPVTSRAARTAGNRVLLVGDAARTVEPLAGLGITIALASAALAAQLIVTHKGIKNPDLLAQAYRSAHASLHAQLAGTAETFRNIILRHPPRVIPSFRAALRFPRLAAKLLGLA